MTQFVHFTYRCPNPPYDDKIPWWAWIYLGPILLLLGSLTAPILSGIFYGIMWVCCKISELIDKLCLKLFNRNSSDIFLYVGLFAFVLPVLIWNVYYIFDCFDCYIEHSILRFIFN